MRCPILLICLVALTLITGCQTQQSTPQSFYQASSGPIFPAINFYAMKPSVALTEQCSQRRCNADVMKVLDGLYTHLQSSKVFQDVVTGPNAQGEYSVHVATRIFYPSNVAADVTRGAIAGATLMLVPLVENREYRSEFVVTWHGLKIAEYNFTTPFEYKISLYDLPAKQDDLVSTKIVADFISSAQSDNVFASERIYEVLKAEDYHRDLKPPVQIGGYRHKDFFLFPDPRAGVQLRYENQAAGQEIVDVFVYPIRQLEWSDTGKVTSDELNIALKDIDLAVKAGVYKSAQFEAPQPISSGVDGEGKGWVSEGKVNWSDGSSTTDFIYVFTAKDKYLKFRFSLPEARPDIARLNEFISGFVTKVVVPEESFFMASLRQKQRSTKVQ